jgi:hypothetical protein
MRPFVSTGALSVVLVVVSLYAISREVWVEMVFRNMPSVTDVAAFTNFFVSAFLHTGLLVQAFSVLALLSAAFLVKEGLKSLPLFAAAKA